MDRRTYNQHCGLAKSLDVVGERWTLLVVRNLLLGPLRYSELLRGLPGITTNLLAKRLEEMEELGLIEQVRAAAGAGHAYRLTPIGAGLEPVVHALGRWGWQWMKEPKRGDLRSIDWLLVALRRRYHGGVVLRAELMADGVPYRLILTEAAAEITRGEVASADVRVRGTGAAVARLFLEPASRKRLPADLDVDGTPAALRTLLGAFATEELELTARPR